MLGNPFFLQTHTQQHWTTMIYFTAAVHCPILKTKMKLRAMKRRKTLRRTVTYLISVDWVILVATTGNLQLEPCLGCNSRWCRAQIRGPSSPNWSPMRLRFHRIWMTSLYGRYVIVHLWKLTTSLIHLNSFSDHSKYRQRTTHSTTSPSRQLYAGCCALAEELQENNCPDRCRSKLMKIKLNYNKMLMLWNFNRCRFLAESQTSAVVMVFTPDWLLISPIYQILRPCSTFTTSAKIHGRFTNSPAIFGLDSSLHPNVTSMITRTLHQFFFFLL